MSRTKKFDKKFDFQDFSYDQPKKNKIDRRAEKKRKNQDKERNLEYHEDDTTNDLREY